MFCINYEHLKVSPFHLSLWVGLLTHTNKWTFYVIIFHHFHFLLHVYPWFISIGCYKSFIFYHLYCKKVVFFFFAGGWGGGGDGGGRVGRGSTFREFLHVSLVIFLREIQNMELWNQNTSIYSITLIQQNSFQKLSVESARSPVQLAMLGSEWICSEHMKTTKTH